MIYLQLISGINNIRMPSLSPEHFGQFCVNWKLKAHGGECMMCVLVCVCVYDHAGNYTFLNKCHGWVFPIILGDAKDAKVGFF